MLLGRGGRLAAAAARRAHSLTVLEQFLKRALADKDARLAAAAHELQARLAAAERELQARLADKDTLVAAAGRELQARLADKDALVAAAEARLAAAERELQARLADKDALMKSQLLAAAFELAVSKHDADVAKGILNVRGLFEACLADIWRVCGPSNARTDERLSVSKKLEQVLSPKGCCPGLPAYLQLAAADNGQPEEEVLRQARKLYETLSARVHADTVEGTTRLPVQVIPHMGGPATVALAAFVRFTGRDISFCGENATSLPLRLRVPPSSCPCRETPEQLQRAPLLGPPASVARASPDVGTDPA